MEILALLAIGLLIGIPTVAVIALVRTARLQKLVEENSWESHDKISDLNREIASLRQELSLVSQRVDRNEAASTPPTPAAVVEPVRVSEPALAPLRASEPERTPELSVHASEASLRTPAQLAAAFSAPRLDFTKQPSLSQSTAPVVKDQSATTNHVVTIPSPVPIPKPIPTPEPVPAVTQEARPEAVSTPRAYTPPPPMPPRAEPPLQAVSQATAPRFASFEAQPPRKSMAERLRSTLPFEEVLGMNLFAKIGIILLVLGFALLGRVALISMGPAARVAMIYGVAATLLGGGIWREAKERYRLVGRTGIGGGWALLFFTTYALYHVPAMTVMTSNTLNCILMLLVAIAMVGHTLRYQSQLVTGLAFLLAFSTVALSQDSVYALVAGVILAVGIVAIALRMGWYELEVFGILASFGNHFYWLYRLFPDGVAGHSFPQFWPSVVILIAYWLLFRISYVARAIRSPRDETVSTIAALLNTMLLLFDMKFQSTHPELAFYALLGLGAVEFLFGQLPVTRRRRAAFILLTVMGTLLIFASVPFKFSGNNIALYWMIAAEVLLIAGIAQLEVLFRRLGLLAGLVTGLLVVYEAWGIVEFRQTSDLPRIQDGILLLTCGALFYLNALVLRRKWSSLFGLFDGQLATGHGYLGIVTAFLGVLCVFTGDWTAIGWAALMLGAVLGKRYLDDNHLLTQGAMLVVAVWLRAVIVNCHLADAYPHHIALRLVTLPFLACVFYGAAWTLSGVEDIRVHLRTVVLWAGSSLLALLAWFEVSPTWIAPTWMIFAVALALLARRIKVGDLAYQGHALAIAAVAQLVAANLYAQSAWERYVPLVGCAIAFYAISRFCTLPDAPYRRPAAWAYTWTGTALIAALAWNESPQPWIAAIWAVFALSLALVDRIFDVEELPYQAHLLALLAVLRAVTLNLYVQDQWHGIDLRLITVSILVVTLYMMARWVRMPSDLPALHAYTWVASSLTAWMLWSELQPIGVAVGLALFGLSLFEFGRWKQQRQIRLQAYAVLAAAFGRIFFVNLTAATLPGEMLSPRIYTVVPIALIYFFVWTQLQSEKAKHEIGRWAPSDLIAHFGTGCVVALLYFQTPMEWIVLAWAVLALALVLAALLFDKEVFQQQAALLVAGIVGRGLAHNIFGGSYFVADGWRGNFAVLSLTAALLLGSLPVAFQLRKRYVDRPVESFLVRYLALKYPEQLFFFAPAILVTFMIAVKMNPGMVTLAWGVEGVIVILLGLLVSQRSYRITGLFLLLLCVGKIVLRDAWSLDERDRYITFIALGAALTLVSTLYGKYRETVRRLL